MRITEIIYLVMVSIMQNKFKVLLTSLGIIVGAMTIVMVIAIGVGGQMDVADQFKNLNAGTIEIESISATSATVDMRQMMQMMQMRSSASTSSSNSNIATLTVSDTEEMVLFINGIKDISLVASSSQSVYGGDLDETTTYTIVGASEEYQTITNLSMYMGEFITSEMEETEARSVILGYDVATEIFTYPMLAYESEIAIDDRTYTVAGVLNKTSNILNGNTVDSCIYMPYSTAEKNIFDTDIKPQMVVLAEDVDQVATIIAKASVLLKEIHPQGEFTISDAGAEMEAALSSANTLSMLLLAVATIVFIVGGIGIMNVLFVSVKERTPEIGVLKALGTSKLDILLQFLIEANLISVIGGIIGVGLSYVIMPLMQDVIRMEPTTEAGIMALVFAIVTGTVFGFYPAYQASQLRPIEALNAK
ncbi:MAG: hypothetical protein BEN19_02885 [Epulopiscium sp. Nuni2H_MBin003]|nr:MAG: hypothetical protein BEN19_02885 [Epulopiscium sp. Nuni2H_MBin003]